MTKKKVYLCGPMEGCTFSEATGWRELVKKMLGGVKYEFLDPCRRDARDEVTTFFPDDAPLEHVEEIVKFNMEDIDSADFIFVHHTRPSTGTDMEVCYAGLRRRLGWPLIVAVVPEGARRHPWLRYFADAIFYTEYAACAWVDMMSRQK